MVGTMRDQAHASLGQYISTIYPHQYSIRFGKLLLLLPDLRNVSDNTIEELFFRKHIGSKSIVKLITEMYKDPDF
jgi:nuclear receptor subfamily 2 group E member 1